MNKEDLLTQVKLKSLLSYSSDTGLFVWKKREVIDQYAKSFNTRRAGREAGAILSRQGTKQYKIRRIIISFNKRPYNFVAHRLAWLYMTGEWPENEIDHIDGNALNNKFDNLRDVDRQENQRNDSVRSDNKSGFTGVNWHKRDEIWNVNIRVSNKSIHIGYFKDKQDAIDARKKANIKYGFHKNHGKPYDIQS